MRYVLPQEPFNLRRSPEYTPLDCLGHLGPSGNAMRPQWTRVHDHSRIPRVIRLECDRVIESLVNVMLRSTNVTDEGAVTRAVHPVAVAFVGGERYAWVWDCGFSLDHFRIGCRPECRVTAFVKERRVRKQAVD
jgi:hypothetical protein